MSEKKDSLWLFPLFGGIIAFIAVLTPVAFAIYYEWPVGYYITREIWMWGFFIDRFYSYTVGFITRFTFSTDPSEVAVEVLATGMILVGIIGLIASANTYRRNRIRKYWVPFTLLMIGGLLIYVIGLEVLTYLNVGQDFWGIFYPGFGVFGPPIGAILSFIGYGLSKKELKERSKPLTPSTSKDTTVS